MNKKIIEALKKESLTWVFCEMRSGLIFGVGKYDKDHEISLIEKMKCNDALTLEGEPGLIFDNSVREFVKEWSFAKMSGDTKELFSVKEKYSVMKQKEWNKLRKSAMLTGKQLTTLEYDSTKHN